MTVIQGMEIGRELSRTLIQINQQIDEVRKEAEKGDVSPYRLRNADGNWVLVPLLAAKAQALHALTLVNQRRT
jgi:hypothetical protein